MEKDLVKVAIGYASEFARDGKGSLFVISDTSISDQYDLLYGKFVRPFSFADPKNRPVIRALASLDGALVVRKGKVVDAGARIKAKERFRGHGTRHSAAFSISKTRGVVSVLSSEEDRKVRIFKNGRLYVEMDPYTKNKVSVMEKIAEIVTNNDASVLASAGLASAALGINPLAAIFVFAGSYVITSKGMASIRQFLRRGIESLSNRD